MTLEQKKIKLAEKLGILSHDNYGPLYKTPQGYVRECPNWPEDLNALHQEVTKLDVVSKRVFAEKLLDACQDWFPGDILGDAFVIYNATALQRFNALYTVLVGDGEEEG